MQSYQNLKEINLNEIPLSIQDFAKFQQNLTFDIQNNIFFRMKIVFSFVYKNEQKWMSYYIRKYKMKTSRLLRWKLNIHQNKEMPAE